MADRWPYGPNTLAVRHFLQQLAALRPDDWAAAARRFGEVERSPRFVRADRALAAAIPAAGRDAERDAALRPLAQLVQAAPGTPDAGAAPDEAPPMDPVAPAAVAAVLALVARDLLPADVFDTLYAPFAELVPVARLG